MKPDTHWLEGWLDLRACPDVLEKRNMSPPTGMTVFRAYPHFIYLIIYHPPMYLPTYQTIYLSICLFIYLPIYLNIHPSIYSSMHLPCFIHTSINSNLCPSLPSFLLSVSFSLSGFSDLQEFGFGLIWVFGSFYGAINDSATAPNGTNIEEGLTPKKIEKKWRYQIEARRSIRLERVSKKRKAMIQPK